MIRYLRRNYYVFGLPIAVVLLGTAGYNLIEHVSLLDAFYMTCITISTVGFKEVVELSPAGKIFTIFMIFAGLTTVAITASRLGQDIVTAALHQQRIRMEHLIARLRDHYILCGYGRMGRVIAANLTAAKCKFVIVDKNAQMIGELLEEGHFAISGDATADEVLDKAGVKFARGLVTVLTTEAENVFVVLTARGLNPNLFVVARANNDDAVSKMYRAGANKVVNPYDSAGARIAQTLMRPSVVDYMEIISLNPNLSISMEEVEVEAGSRIADKPLRETDIRKETNAIVIAIRRHGTGEMLFNPSGAEIAHPGDLLVALTEISSLESLTRMAKTQVINIPM